ncbi:MAG: heme exporter protein CcmB, partial [Phycisphaeraceae bacterium]|nr:heme exporter protein CcmB [Phycisphaeraceae bacterium]
MSALRQLVVLCHKDLRIEARNRQTVVLVVVLGLLIIVILGLSLGPQQLQQGPAAVAALWTAYLFGGVLCFEKTMAVERQDGALAALLLAPVDRGVIYFSKLLSNLVLMLALAAVVTPVAVVMFHFDLSQVYAPFALLMALSMVGYAAVGTLFAAAVSSTRLQGGLLAMVVFPICLPLVIASTQTMLRWTSPDQTGQLQGLGIIVAFDVVYLVTSWVVFELMIEP